ncbi:MAG: LacI family DNA-binding transcriptional regulator [Verrucomicrobia bacterium]|nr:LacI family DNA-binding transcriptional regulator [Verrucomicrobiota bacterium]MCH8510222.1 LacI family transcriptional regulator [Kiritimatiellia bacterium]
MPTSKKVTTKTLAAELGVSQRTVSEALNNPENKIGLKQETIHRIREHAAKRGYRPNVAAREMRLQQVRDVGLLLSSHEMEGSASMLEGVLPGMLDGLSKTNRGLRVNRMTDEALSDQEVLRNLLTRWGVAGLMINYLYDEPDSFRAFVHQTHMPAVWLNSLHESDSILPDDFEAGREITRRFLATGSRRPAYVDLYPSHHYSCIERRDGYLAATREAEIKPLVLDGDEAGLGEWFDAHNPDALFIYNLYSFLTLESFFRQRGRDDVRRVFVNEQSKMPLSPNVKVMIVPGRELGRAAVEMLERKLDTGEDQPNVRVPLRIPTLS